LTHEHDGEVRAGAEGKTGLNAGGRIRAPPPIANGPERGVYAASSFGSLQANRFVYARSDTEAA
jgi:hypothetical protein